MNVVSLEWVVKEIQQDLVVGEYQEMGWLRLGELQRLELLKLMASYVDGYECVGVDDGAFLCARKVVVRYQMLQEAH